VSYGEIKNVIVGDTVITLKAFASGNSVGGTIWHLEYNKQQIIYAVDINDQETPISHPLNFNSFKGANLLITNGYISPVQNGHKMSKIYNYVNEEKLKNRLEHIMMDPTGQVLIPISSKNRILHILVLLENIFSRS